MRAGSRLRLADNTNWEVADRIEATDRLWYEEQILTAIIHFIRHPMGHDCAPQCLVCKRWQPHVDDFIAAYPKLSVIMRNEQGEPLVCLPARGDLVRLLRKYPHLVRYDRNTFELSLAA